MTASILVIDIGGTSVKFAGLANGMPLAATHQVATADLRRDDPIRALAALIPPVATRLGLAPQAIVASVPGFLDPDRDLVRTAGNIPEFNGRRLASELSALTGLPVTLERDAILTLLGEWWAGAGRGVDQLLGLFFGTGVGGAFLDHGRPFRGAGFALEIGNMPFKAEGRTLAGMRTDCLEAYVSGRVLAALAAEAGVPVETVFLEAPRRPELARALDRFLIDQAVAIGIAVSLFSPRATILGGGICEMAGFPFDRVAGLVAQHSTARETGEPLDLRPAALGWQAALHGAPLALAGPRAAG